MTKHDPTQVQSRLLSAVEDILISEGLNGLTLEAVAKKADVSKGGLLYHFKSKDDLIEGILARMVREWNLQLEFHWQAAKPGPGRMARALSRLIAADPVLNSPDTEQSRRQRGLCGAVMAATVNNPDLLKPVRASYEALLKRIEDDGLDPGRTIAIVAALDGLWFATFFNFYTLSPKQRTSLLQAIEELAQQK